MNVSTTTDNRSAEQSVDERFLRVPLEVLTTPREGALCYLNRYWLVTDADEALFYKHYTSPQCNTDKSIVERRLKRPGTKVVFVPVAYIRHNCSDYV